MFVVKQVIFASYQFSRCIAKQKTPRTVWEKLQLLLWCHTVVGMVMLHKLEEIPL